MYIYPDVSIVEDVHIGNSITIGTVIAKDVLEGATVAGNPAKEFLRKDNSKMVHNKCTLP